MGRGGAPQHSSSSSSSSSADRLTRTYVSRFYEDKGKYRGAFREEPLAMDIELQLREPVPRTRETARDDVRRGREGGRGGPGDISPL